MTAHPKYGEQYLQALLTTAAVFVPVIFVQDQAGQLFRDIAIAISVSVILSLIVSITVIPTVSAKILSVVKPKPGKEFHQPLGTNTESREDFNQHLKPSGLHTLKNKQKIDCCLWFYNQCHSS